MGMSGGWQALAELLRTFSTGEQAIRCGELTMAFGNLPAIAKEVRYIEQNLNRLFLDDRGGAPTFS